jgi:hypothetical protein
VNAQPRDLAAPFLRPGLGIGQVHELLTGEEVSPYVLHGALDAWFGQPRQMHLVGRVSRCG